MSGTPFDLTETIREDVRRALEEDVGSGDRTAALIPEDKLLETEVVCRQNAVMAGRAWFDEAFRQIDQGVRVAWKGSDGDEIKPDEIVCRVIGPARSVLTGERTALNFLQLLSGTATQTAEFVKAVAGTGTTILDTRKTIPGMRHAQKYAVRCGGGTNHRVGLFDAILIKENHISAAGSVASAIAAAKREAPELLLEVEVENMQQLDEAVKTGAQRVMLDNFPIDILRQAVDRFRGKVELEASGGISLMNVREYAETGVDFISTGQVTKNVIAVDFSMRFR